MFKELLHSDESIMIFFVVATLISLFVITIVSMTRQTSVNRRLKKVVNEIETDFLIRDSLPPRALTEDEKFDEVFAKTFNL
jgi:archaellum component FlaG (FlaF/FlaG flagellin family)